jgi:hypothetical protein
MQMPDVQCLFNSNKLDQFRDSGIGETAKRAFVSGLALDLDEVADEIKAVSGDVFESLRELAIQPFFDLLSNSNPVDCAREMPFKILLVGIHDFLVDSMHLVLAFYRQRTRDRGEELDQRLENGILVVLVLEKREKISLEDV